MKARVPFLLVLASLLPAPSRAAAPRAARTIDASSIKSDQIRTLLKTESDGTLVKLGGQTLTVGQMKAFELKRKSLAVSKPVAPTRVRIKTAGLQTNNQKVLAHVAQLTGNTTVAQQAKLRDEAWDLSEKLKTASGGEKGQIQQRLAQIGSQMKR